ncbi:PAS domain S-box-containing protein [Halohasta litchfieldiae]|jgi:PAS domain S-box-containing protein|uniref:PAS domain S-box-containing protein n=1 Tax=Halohasta litchfieldiae TaxID=1073996 RepID=A0A1H6TX39_9EURY|nr:PAS domain-containing protein [Halohasta litchfieldiae]ATW87183.1 PAS domain S-box-containing protein [Halohasta litchfieldiae]SEI83766.1 PAS domain S-box-containing protein [Halohasta litchfieldiae]
MIDRQQRIQALYEISLSIGPKETLKATADNALSGYLKKLNCSVGTIFQRTLNDDDVRYDITATIPASPHGNDTLMAAIDHLPGTVDDHRSFIEALPISGETDNGAHYYLMELPEFGVLVLGKRGGEIDEITQSALKPLNEKLAEACRSQLVEGQLRTERNRFEAVFDAIPEPVVNTVIEHGEERVKRVNRPFENTFGYTEQTARDRPITDLIIPEGTDGDISPTSLHDGSEPREVRCETATGIGEFLFRRVPVDSQGSREYIHLYVDITSQKKRQQELERYERLVENLPIGVFRTTPGPKGEFRLVNQGFVDIFEGDSSADFEGLSVADIYVDPTDRERFSNQLLEQGSVDGVELQLQTVDGNPIWCEISGIAVEEDGETVFELALQNITERKERQQQLAVLNRVLRHNLRNGMNVIRGNTSLLSAEIDDGTLQTHVTAIEQRVENLEQLSEKAGTVRSLFDQGREVNVTCDVGELLSELKSEFEERHPTAGLTIEPFEPVAVRADVRLKMALLEIVDNAVVHNNQAVPAISVAVGRSETKGSDDWVDITITDNGPGIPDDERRAIETGEETPLQHGTGLGLWLVYWTVSLLGGEITIADHDAGTRIILTLPRASAHQSTHAANVDSH